MEPDVLENSSETSDGGDDDVSGTVGGARPLLPAIAQQLDGVRDTLAGLSTRLEALGASNGTVLSELSDRVNEHMELVAGLLRTQAGAIDDYRQGNEQAISELRRSAADREADADQVRGRIDDVAGRLEHLSASSFQQAVPPPIDAQALAEPIVRAVVDSAGRGCPRFWHGVES